MNIDLCKPLDLPDEFVTRLKKIEKLCISQKFSESLVEHSDLATLVRDINQYCLKNKIIGIHYTRAIPESILSQGLLIRNGNEIRDLFLSEHGHLFSQDEILIIKDRWYHYFDNRQSSVRNGRIFFNFTEIELGCSGTKYLLGLYGGEQVSMCFELDEPLGLKLGTIGQPIVVRCSLDPNQVKTFIENPWGKILVSSFHALINPDVFRIDQDGYQLIPVKPEDIIELRVLKK
ncbi:hypothetical protein [Photorhabdus tasmaniensis]|uniref:Uncharacterized protein n=1 Tax=Photorhabdus tasmaniensis TaxID=1004159 RepID=A0ABX0GNQ5_9GAMM|nr:hypothetical protein [Photorhabdus tasmaniensis]NHB89828.1 hypothetical protein [Photorhabdus tasmaniensis]